MKQRKPREWATDGKIVNNFAFKPEFKQYRRKNNVIVQAMYAMYLSGKSLGEVAKAYHRTRQAVFDVFRVSTRIQTPTEAAQGSPCSRRHQIHADQGRLLPGSHSDGRRILMHHYVWEKHHGPIPPNHIVRIVNGNRQDCRIENLEFMSLSDWNKNSVRTSTSSLHRPDRDVRSGPRRKNEKRDGPAPWPSAEKFRLADHPQQARTLIKSTSSFLLLFRRNLNTSAGQITLQKGVHPNGKYFCTNRQFRYSSTLSHASFPGSLESSPKLG